MRLYVVECVLLSVCLAVLCCLMIVRGLTCGQLRQLTEMNPEEKQNTYNRLLCAVPDVPDRWEARSILLLSVYSPAYLLPMAHPCPTYYYTILLYYIVNTLTMYLLLYCVLFSLSVGRSLVGSLCLVHCAVRVLILSWLGVC